jgi:hypothetical protein
MSTSVSRLPACGPTSRSPAAGSRRPDGPGDGGVLPAQGSATPALTISALAARTADRLGRAAPRGDLASRPSPERVAV